MPDQKVLNDGTSNAEANRLLASSSACHW